MPVAVVLLLVAGPLLGPAVGSPRGLQVLVFAALLVAAGSLGLWSARRLLPPEDEAGDGGASRAVAAVAAATAWLIVPAYALGTLGRLEPRIYLPVLALLYLGGRLLARRVLPASAGAGERGRLHHRLRKLADRPAAARELALLGAAGLAVAISFVGLVQDERYRPPDKLDDPSYHLSAVAVWHQHGDLRMPKLPHGDMATPFYPIGPDVVSWSLLAPFGDSDVAARWSQLPFALATLVALAAVARRLGVSRRGAAVAALLYSAIPRSTELALGAGNDHSTAFFTVALADAVVAVARRPTTGRAAYAGLAFGLLAGTKLIGLLYALPLVVLLAAALGARSWTDRRAGGSPSATALAGTAARLGRVAAVAGAVAFVVGGYTYLRNAWSLGNPFFPLPVAGLPGWEHATMAIRRTLPEFDIAVGDFLWRRKDFWGSYFRLTLLPAAIVAPFAAAAGQGLRGRADARPSRVRRLEEDVVLALPLLYFGLFLYWMHDHRDIRYLLPAVALAAVAAGWLADGAPGRTAPVARGGLAALVLWAVVVRLPGSDLKALAAAGALYGVARLALVGVRRGSAGRLRSALAARPAVAAAAPLLLALGLVGLAWRSGETVESYQARKLHTEAPAEALEQLAGGEPAVVAYFGLNRPYFFFGRRLQHRVEMVPLAGPPEERWYDWGGTADFPFHGVRYPPWRRNLERLGVDFVVLELAGTPGPPRRWMLRRPDAFHQLFEDPRTEIWRVE